MSVENDSSQVQSLASGSGYPSYPVAPGYRLNVRSGPGTNYSVIDVLPVGAIVTLRCQTEGTTVSGPYGTSSIWDCIGNGRFVSDAYIKTGSDGYVVTPLRLTRLTRETHPARAARRGIIAAVSDDQRDQTPAEPAGAAAPARAAASEATGPVPPAGPQPEPLRFFGTTWVNHENGYGLRRAALAVGSLVTATAAAVLLRLSYEGLEIGDVGPFLSISVVVLFAIASAIAFVKTWDSFSRRPAPSSDEAALKGLKTIGFIGSLIAYSLRCLTEAPGEKLHRAEYERARAEYARRRSTRTGNPAARRPKRKKQ